MTAVAPPSNSLVAGKYQLVALIGRGGMGSVWEGRHVSLGTRVAIKFIEKEYADSVEARKRFDNEAHAAARIQSKYAIQIHDHGITDDGKPFIVMEYLQGEPLDKRLERVKRMPLQEIARILNQVGRALTRAHDNQIVHRDLKPENIFLVKTPDDDDEIAKVLDFGIAKIRGSEGQALSNSTKTGAVLGTPYYMSPEQARGLRDIDHRTDLWSLGVIVFKCATGVLPFDGESLGDLLVKICTSPLPVPSHVMPGLPPSFDSWFQRALDRDPKNRFATAQEMADALAFAVGVSVKRGPVSSDAGPELVRSPTTPGYPVSSGGYASTPGSAAVSPYAASGRGSQPGAATPVPYDGKNVTAAGLSASASRSFTVPKREGGALKWVLGGVGLTLVVAAVVVAAFVAGRRTEDKNKAAASAPVVAPAISVQLSPPGTQPQVPSIATELPTAPPTPPISVALAPTDKPGTTAKPPSGHGHTTTNKPPSTASTGSSAPKPPTGGTKPNPSDPGF